MALSYSGTLSAASVTVGSRLRIMISPSRALRSLLPVRFGCVMVFYLLLA